MRVGMRVGRRGVSRPGKAVGGGKAVGAGMSDSGRSVAGLGFRESRHATPGRGRRAEQVEAAAKAGPKAAATASAVKANKAS